MRRAAIVLPCVFAFGAGAARSSDTEAPDDAAHWRLAVSPATHHWHHNPEHRQVWALAAERQRDDGWLRGASFFGNSFGQPSGYLYVGKRYDNWLGQPQLFLQWSAGLMYGYVGRFKNKVPLNVDGFSPGVLLSAGWQFDRHASAQFNLLGDAGVMLQLSFELR